MSALTNMWEAARVLDVLQLLLKNVCRNVELNKEKQNLFSEEKNTIKNTMF